LVSSPPWVCGHRTCSARQDGVGAVGGARAPTPPGWFTWGGGAQPGVRAVSARCRRGTRPPTKGAEAARAGTGEVGECRPQGQHLRLKEAGAQLFLLALNGWLASVCVLFDGCCCCWLGISRAAPPRRSATDMAANKSAAGTGFVWQACAKWQNQAGTAYAWCSMQGEGMDGGLG
jgi:hypothetical protein